MCLFEKEDQSHSLKEAHIVNPSILLGENPIILLWMNKHGMLDFELCNSSLPLEKEPPQKVVICSQESSCVLSLARNRCMASRLDKNRGVSTVDDYMKTNQQW